MGDSVFSVLSVGSGLLIFVTLAAVAPVLVIPAPRPALGGRSHEHS
jgi:hypothetical protein